MYSLRDAKGEPHATIEVGSSQPYRAFDEVNSGVPNPPDRITQIKGKSNRAPNDEYLPYVQDFVKSGKWSDVNDLHNTGLLPFKGGYTTKKELEELVKPAQEWYLNSPYHKTYRSMNDVDYRGDQYKQLDDWSGKMDVPVGNQRYSLSDIHGVLTDPAAFDASTVISAIDAVDWLKANNPEIPAHLIPKDSGMKRGGPVNQDAMQMAVWDKPVRKAGGSEVTQAQIDAASKPYMMPVPKRRGSFDTSGAKAAGTMLSGIVASIPAGYAGALELVRTLDPKMAADASEAMQERYMSIPEDQRTIEKVEGLAKYLEPLSVPAQYIGEKALGLTGSPLAATAAEMVLDPLNYLPFIGKAPAAAKAVGRAASKIASAELTGRSGLSGQRGAITYHGTPHRFPPTANNPLGEFDASKIGTGEGAQAYGHGLYLAGAKSTAEYYKQLALGALDANPYDASVINRFMGKSKTPSNDYEGLAAYALADSMVSPFKYSPVEAMKRLRDKARESRLPQDTSNQLFGLDTSIPKDQLKNAAKYIREFSDKTDGTGAISHLYTVDLPDEHIANMLDWDKPLSEQPKFLQAIKGTGFENADTSITGRQFVRDWLGGSDSSNPEVAYALKAIGVPGIRYLDQGSRAGGEGTSNFVVFDPAHINIIGREKKGGLVNQDAMQMAVWDKAEKKARGGILGAAELAAKIVKKVSTTDKALPLSLGRATPKTTSEIDSIASRIARQMTGEHVTSGKPKDTQNLAGRSMLENKRVKALDYVVEPTGAAKESVIYQPRKGDVNIAIPGDQTISDSILRSVGDIEGIDSYQQGGAKYGLGKMDMEDPLFWASGKAPAQMAQNKITRVSEFYDPERVVGQHLAMGPVSNNFAMHLADANLRAMDLSNMSRQQMNAFDKIIAYEYKDPKTKEKKYFPEWPGIANPEAAMEAMRANPELRKWFNDRMKTPSVTEPLGLPNGLDIQYAVTEPQLRNMEVNMTGLSAGEMVPYANLTDTAAHNTYDKGIRGLSLGHQEVLTPFELSFPDSAQHIASTKRPQDFTGTIQKVFPHQIVDDQYLDEIGRYRDLIKKYTGKKKGGKVQKKAAGGLTSDDLVLEERKL